MITYVQNDENKSSLQSAVSQFFTFAEKSAIGFKESQFMKQAFYNMLRGDDVTRNLQIVHKSITSALVVTNNYKTE